MSLNEAREELIRRQEEETALVKAVNEILGENCPIPQGQYGFLARHIASARFEDLEFKKRCREINLQPINLEYVGDIFVSNNPSKVRLIRMLVFCGYGRNGGSRIKRVDLLPKKEVRQIDGKVQLSQLSTYWGESLVSFHHRARRTVGLEEVVIDVSSWLNSIGLAKEYFKYLLAACLTRGILFESFESPGFPDLETFKKKVVVPAYNWATINFGFVPLIVKHPETFSLQEEARVLNWYPREVLEAIPQRGLS